MLFCDINIKVHYRTRNTINCGISYNNIGNIIDDGMVRLSEW